MKPNYDKVHRHIFDAIHSDGFEDCHYFNECSTDEEKAKFSYERFHSEYGYHIKRYGIQTATKDWLQGLALSIAFTNSEILKLAIEWGSLPDNPTEKQEDKILENYWSFMATQLVKIWNKHKVGAS